MKTSTAPIASSADVPPVVSSDATAEEWDAFVDAQPDATGYHLWRWREVFERGLGQKTCYFIARQNGTVVGVLPTVRVRGFLFGSALSSLPYVNYGGVLAASPAAAKALVQHVAGVVSAERLSYAVLRHRRRVFLDLPVRSHKQAMLLPLGETSTATWNGLDRKVRNQIRKAEKSGLTVLTGGHDLLGDFYAVFARNMRDLGTPVYGRQLFTEMVRASPDDVRIHVVRLNGTTIAAAVSYRFRDVVEVPSASSLREHRALCPNHMLYWHIIQTSIVEGARTLDFGRSTPGDGTYHFKEQWGARPEQLEWEYVLGRGTQLPTADRQDSRFNVVITAWKRLPLDIATALGPRIARAIP